MRFLFIKPKSTSETLLMTPTMVAVKKAHPTAEIWVLVRRGCEKILDGCPEIDYVLTVAPVEKSERSFRDWWRDPLVLLRLALVRFDVVVELGDGHRARLFAMLARARKRYSVLPVSPLKPHELKRFDGVSTFDGSMYHRVQKDFYTVSEFLDVLIPIPGLRFDKSLTRSWRPGRNLTNFVVVQIGARQPMNCWNRESWRELCRGLLERYKAVVVTCGPVAHERELALWLQKELGSGIVSTKGDAGWDQIADLLYRAKLYVGLNTAAMHLAAACGCPVVALFGPSTEDYWYPWQVPYRIVTSAGYIPLPDTQARYAQVKERKMDAIQAEAVLVTCDELRRSTMR